MQVVIVSDRVKRGRNEPYISVCKNCSACTQKGTGELSDQNFVYDENGKIILIKSNWGSTVYPVYQGDSISYYITPSYPDTTKFEGSWSSANYTPYLMHIDNAARHNGYMYLSDCTTQGCNLCQNERYGTSCQLAGFTKCENNVCTKD